MKGIVFDLDNTLYDRYATIRAIMETNYEIIRPYLNPGYDFEKAYEHACRTEALYICKGWKVIYKKLCDEHFFNEEKIPPYEPFFDLVLKGLANCAVGFDGIRDFLTDLRARGYKLGIITNCNNNALQRSKLERLGFDESLFDVIVLSGEYALETCGDTTVARCHKPYPGVFRYTAKKLGLPPEELFYVGDSPANDVMGALNSGYVPIWIRSRSPWVLENKYLPERCADKVTEISEFL